MKTSVLFMMLVLVIPVLAGSETPAEKGLAIAREAERRADGFQDFTAKMLMVLRNRHGEENVRRIRVKVLEVEGDGDKSLMIFDSPGDVKGTAFLNYSHKKGDDDQWLYLPALKRVKRISARNKSGSFMGSEFSYEDISGFEVEKYTYRWVRNEICRGHECFVTERYPVDKENSGYSRQVAWIDKKEYRTLKVEYYDKRGERFKTLSVKGYKEYLDRFWRAKEMEMVNHKNGKSTTLVWTEYEFRTGLNESDFSRNALKRVR